MPLIDVSELLTDPDFADEFVLVRHSRPLAAGVSAKGVDVDGMTLISTSAPVPLVGVIQPAGEATLVRMADGSMMANTIEIHSQTILISATEDLEADEVVYLGVPFTVTDVADWPGSAWGSAEPFAP